MILEAKKKKKERKGPPEHIVKALKKKKGVDNPYALANYIANEDECEANAANTMGPVQRAAKMKCSLQVVSGTPGTALEGPRVRVVLISEGLGNRANMNYYGPEAIDSAPAVFEGKPCFLNHPSESEERDIPERRVQDKCGYFKGVHVETIDGRRSVVAELHFDLSESGRMGYEKAMTAVHYNSEFPALDSDYIGLSVNANGDFEERSINFEGQDTDVNYVLRFVESPNTSCDIVTLAGRGGRFLALVESAAGASTSKKQEDGHMKEKLKKCLEAARSALKEALKETDPEKAKKKMAESDQLFDTFFKEAKQQSADPENQTEETSQTETEESETDTEESKKDKEDMDEADDGDEDDNDEEMPVAKKKKKEKKESKDKESALIVVKMLAKEAKVDLDAYQLNKLAGLSLQEAKAEIASLKAFKESIVRSAVKAMEIPGANFEKLTESERATEGSKNNELFAGCVK